MPYNPLKIFTAEGNDYEIVDGQARNMIGDLSGLDTTDKSSLVAAVNELNTLPLENGTGARSVQTRHDDEPANVCVASGVNSLALGARATATNLCSIAIGAYNRNVENGAGPICTGQQAIAFGVATQATAHGAVAIGQQSKATGQLSFALGGGAEANAQGAYALGMFAKANGSHSHAFGPSTTANGKNQFVTGTRNIADDNDEFALIVGNGTKVDGVETPSNAMTLDWDGNAVIAGKMTVGVAPTNNMDVATKKYVDDNIPTVTGTFTNAAKMALLALLEKVAYIDDDGQDYLNTLQAELFPVAATSISAVFTQGQAVIYDTDSLDVLKQYLVVTATFSDGTTSVVTNYTLSGTLTEGTSTITVTYNEKTDTFTVSVTHADTYVTDGLIHYWDAINNTSNGHDASTATWTDLIGGNNLNINDSSHIEWLDNAVKFDGTNGVRFLGINNAPDANNKTLEVVFSQTVNRAECICSMFYTSGGSEAAYGKVNLFADNSFNVVGFSAKSYLSPTIGNFHYIAASFNGATSINKVYANGEAATLGNASHSLNTITTKPSIGASPANYDYPFNGKVHSIRIYNRILTDQEIAQNYAVDVRRFGFGA